MSEVGISSRFFLSNFEMKSKRALTVLMSVIVSASSP
jgi:hypothetical protein